MQNVCLVNDLCVVSMPLGNKSYSIGRSVYYPGKWCHFYKEEKEHNLISGQCLVGWMIEA